MTRRMTPAAAAGTRSRALLRQVTAAVRPHRGRLLRIAAATAVVLWLITGGWKSVPGQVDSTPRPAPPRALERLWTQVVPDADRMATVAWSTGDTVVLRYGDTLRGHALADGRRVWERPLPPDAAGICGISATANARGEGAVHYLVRGRGCTRLDVLDADTGRLRWGQAVAHAPGRDWHAPAVGGTNVVLGMREKDTRRSRVLRFALSDGRPQPAVGPRAGCSLDSTAYSGEHIVLTEVCGPARASHLTVHTTASGDRLWSRPLPFGTGVEALVADRPLTLLLGGGDGGRRMAVFPVPGRPGVPLVDAVDSRDFAPLGNYWHLDGPLLAVRTNGGVAAYDLATRTQLWTWGQDPVADLLGTDDGRAIIAGCPASPPPYPCFTAIRLADGRLGLAGTLPDVGPPRGRPQTAFHLLPQGQLILMVQRTNDGESMAVSAHRLSRP